MSLVTYEETRPWAKAIRERVITRNMPPWHIDKTVGIQQFPERPVAHRRADRDHRALGGFRRADGRSKDLPPPRQWPAEEGWQLAKQYGQPDLVLKSEPYTMPAHGQDVWFRPLTEIPLTEPRWVRAVEMRPGTRGGPQDHAPRAGAAAAGGSRTRAVAGATMPRQ